ncbi:serine hydrolase [Phenylobacterium sp. LjRoot225]|uniref:serine hydrolase domain-containing protein n=1 Tax=Phenylobacterium sp. LjRoot225 TaxID=3342285 RepID=UPI003ECEE167
MRSLVPALVALVALLAAPHGAPAHAQEIYPYTKQNTAPAAPEAPASSSPAPDLPKRPIPYTKLVPKPRPKPRPATKPASAPTKPAAATSPTTPSPPAAVVAAPPPAAPALPPAASVPPVVPPAAPPAPGARLQPGQPIPPGELETFVDGLVKQAMARQHVAGVTVSVVQNGQILLKKGYGFARLSPDSPVDPDRTLFRLGSISQTFTWIGVMREVEAGRMRLDQPLNLYLPERIQVRDQGFDRPIRVVDLMDHAAGFEDRAFGHLYEQDRDYVRPLELYLRRERPRRVRPPGQLSSYSHYGAGLAGEATSWVSGRPFERLMEEDIFLPLGMNHTTFRERRPQKAALPAPMPDALAADVADGFHWTHDGFERRPYEYIGQIAPAASASSTAGDMARYMLALLGGGQFGGVSIYGPRTAQAFRTPILATPAGVNGWAHGFVVEPLPGGRNGYGHPGATLAFVSNMVTAPDLGLGVFIAANTETGLPLVQDLPQAVVREFYAAPSPYPRTGSSELAAEAARFAGHYLSTRRTYTGLEGFVGRLLGDTEVRVSPDGRLVTKGEEGLKVWVPEGPAAEGRFVALQGEERLAFKMADGRATAFVTTTGMESFDRIAVWRWREALILLAGLTGLAAIFSLAGAMLRDRRELRESQVQGRAAMFQNIQAGLWLIAMASFGVWGAKALADPARLVFDWPGGLLVTASACSLVAAALTMTTIFALPAVWRGGRRVDSWPILRRAGFTLTVVIYAAFSIVLARSGALLPWSG